MVFSTLVGNAVVISRHGGQVECRRAGDARLSASSRSPPGGCSPFYPRKSREWRFAFEMRPWHMPGRRGGDVRYLRSIRGEDTFKNETNGTEEEEGHRVGERGEGERAHESPRERERSPPAGGKGRKRNGREARKDREKLLSSCDVVSTPTPAAHPVPFPPEVPPAGGCQKHREGTPTHRLLRLTAFASPPMTHIHALPSAIH